MKVKISKFQEGGQVAAPEQVMAPGAEQAQGGGAEEQLAQMSMQIIQQLGPEAAAALAQMIVELLKRGQAPQEAPVYAKQGGKLVKVRK